MASATTSKTVDIPGNETVKVFSERMIFVNKTSDIAIVFFRDKDFYLNLGSKDLLAFDGMQKLFIQKADSCTLEYDETIPGCFLLNVSLTKCDSKIKYSFRVNSLANDFRLMPSISGNGY